MTGTFGYVPAGAELADPWAPIFVPSVSAECSVHMGSIYVEAKQHYSVSTETIEDYLSAKATELTHKDVWVRAAVRPKKVSPHKGLAQPMLYDPTKLLADKMSNQCYNQ